MAEHLKLRHEVKERPLEDWSTIAVELLGNLMKPSPLRTALFALVDFVTLGFLALLAWFSISITERMEEFEAACACFARCVKPGGALVGAFLVRSGGYVVADHPFPVLHLSSENIIATFNKFAHDVQAVRDERVFQLEDAVAELRDLGLRVHLQVPGHL